MANTLKYLHDQLDADLIAEQETAPLLEVQLELVAPDVQYKPQLSDAEASVSDMTRLVRSEECRRRSCHAL